LSNIFERATREKTRFSFKGVLSVEDLWDLSVNELDGMFKTLNSKLKVEKEESLIGPKNKTTTDLEFKVEIVRYIVGVKLEEATAREVEASKREKKQKILGILVEKQNADLLTKSTEELTKMLEEL